MVLQLCLSFLTCCFDKIPDLREKGLILAHRLSYNSSWSGELNHQELEVAVAFVTIFKKGKK